MRYNNQELSNTGRSFQRRTLTRKLTILIPYLLAERSDVIVLEMLHHHKNTNTIILHYTTLIVSDTDNKYTAKKNHLHHNQL